MRRDSVVLSAAWLIIASSAVAQAQGSEVIRGRVVGREHHALEGVEVTIVTESGDRTRSAKTDKDGRYVIAIPAARDTYTLTFRRVGYVQFSRVVRRADLGSTNDLEDVVLSKRLDLLEPVVTRAAVLVPSRTGPPELGATKLDARGGSQFTIDPSDLGSLIALLPGVQSAGDGSFAVLGAAPDQNRTVVDGADFGGGRVPRDGLQRVELVTSTFDPSQGRFAGGETVVSTRPGTPTFESMLRVELLHPSLSWADPRSTTTLPLRSSLSGYASGPLHGERLRYMAAVDMSNRTANASSLLDPRDEALSALGISRDSVVAVTNALPAVGVPLGSVGQRNSVFEGSALTRVDFLRSATTSFTMSAIANWLNARRPTVGALAFPRTGDRTDDASGRLLMGSSTYLGHVLDEVHLSAAVSRHRSSPLAAMPAGVVRVGTSTPEGRTGWTSLQFGGSGSAALRLHDDVLHATHDMSWVSGGGTHQIKLTEELVLQRQEASDGSDLFGTFEYANLDDLLANRPSQYHRTLTSRHSIARAMTLGASVGDSWQVVPGRLHLQGGLRIDATRFGIRPAFNAAADSLFDLRTDRVPSNVGLSPRLGFVWRPVGTSATPLVPSGTTVLGTQGVAARRAPLDAAGVGIPPDADYVTITGGVGAFRGSVPLSRVASLVEATGLPSTVRSLSCVGEATPTPDWSQTIESLPDACLDGAGVFADNERDVSVFGRRFRAPVSWRGNIAIDGIHVAGLAIAPQLSYSIGKHVESRIDRNLVVAPAFTLAAEGNRPVFVPVPAIDPRTGLIGPGAGRLVPDIARVTERLSDLEYHAAQLTIGAAPRQELPGGGRVYAVYSWTPQRFLARGFDGTTAGDPRTLGWSTSPQPVHQLIFGATNVGTKWLRVAARLSATSGLGLTPMIAQDVNGDGLANDRAFVVDPAATADTTLANQMRSLLASAGTGVRRCLTRQLGTLARANSCRTGWRARLDLAINASPPEGFGFGDRWRVTATIFNASSALVRLFHLDNTALGRGARYSIIDQRLLYVAGFDSATRRFRYRVNQQFGAAMPVPGGGGLPPFELQIGLQLRLGPSPSAARLPVTTEGSREDAVVRIRADLASRFLGPDPILEVLDLGDSLALEAAQREGILSVENTYVMQRDSILAPVVAFVLARGQKLTKEELNSRMQSLFSSLRSLGDRSRQRARSFLTTTQQQQLDALLRSPNRRKQ